MTIHKYLIGGLGVATVVGFAGAAQAAIVSPVTVEFETVHVSGAGGAIYGKANLTPTSGDVCPSPISDCYKEDGFVVGPAEDTANPGAHLHAAGTPANRYIAYHQDSAGLYGRALDGTAFSLESLKFGAHTSSENPGTGPNDNWEILGFNAAFNPGLDGGDGTNYATRVAYRVVPNGFDGTLTLDAAFHDIKAFWIHYQGYPKTPADGKQFAVHIDDIRVAAPVPLPAALWVFISGLTSLALLGRRGGSRG